ncbi:beta-1,6-N-acetylglucosaminyltransferase, partial [Enterococcus sp. C54]
DNFDMLSLLLKELDDIRNDIVIHIDKKSSNVNIADLKTHCQYSEVSFIESISVTWGAYSQIECELALLKAAVKRNYNYYHLISGLDFPLKSQDYIHEFFDKNDGKEYIQFQQPKIKQRNLERVMYYYPFQEKVGKKKNFLWFLGKLYKIIQKFLNSNRIKSDKYTFQMGANWFSITNDLAKYVLEQEKFINDYFKDTINGDELFLQTIVYNSKFLEKVNTPNFDNSCHSNMRYVVWENDTPKYFCDSDYDMLINREELFARKFNVSYSGQLVNKLKNAKERRYK